MPRTHPAYPAEFRRQMVELVRSGRSPSSFEEEFEPSGPLGDLQLGNGLTENHGFTDRYFPSNIQVNGASTVLQWLYSTDAVGNISAITDGLDATQNRLYTYQDFQYYLTSEDGPWGTRAWTYDQIGNRLTEDKDALPQEVYLYLPNGASGNTPILDEIQASSATLRDYAYGPAGHLERVTAGANEVLFTSNAEGRLSRLDRATGDARSDLTYEGRSFLSNASASPATTIFTDGFEDGDARCWTTVVGDPNPPTPETCTPFPETLPVYSSDGLLLAVTKDPGQTSELTRSYFYFAGRPVAQLDRTPTAPRPGAGSPLTTLALRSCPPTSPARFFGKGASSPLAGIGAGPRLRRSICASRGSGRMRPGRTLRWGVRCTTTSTGGMSGGREGMGEWIRWGWEATPTPTSMECRDLLSWPMS